MGDTLDIPPTPAPKPQEAEAKGTTRFYLERKVTVTLSTPLVPAMLPLYNRDTIVFPYQVTLRWYKDRPEQPWTAARIQIDYHPRLKDRGIGKRALRLDVYDGAFRKRQGDASMKWLADIIDRHTPTTETELIEREPLTKPSKSIPAGATGQRAEPTEHDGTPEATERIQTAMLR